MNARPRRRRGRPALSAPSPPPPDVLPLRIVANAPTVRLSGLPADVEIQAAAGEGKRPKVKSVAYTGATMRVAAFYYPVVVDLSGLRVSGQEIPLLRDHDTGRVVGQTDAVQIGADVQVAGVITSDGPDAADITGNAKNGFKWKASIGADVIRREFLDVGNTTTVNGREVTGPLVIAREAELMEVSIVSIGADNRTSVDVAASGSSASNPESTMFETWLKAKGFDPAALSPEAGAFLRAQYDREQATPPAVAPPANPPAPAVAPPAPPVQAAGGNGQTPPENNPTRTLETILAEHAAEEERVSTITREVEDAIRARPTLRNELGRIGRAAIEARTTIDQFRLTVLRLRAEVGPAPAGHAIHVHRDAKAGADLITAAVCQRAKLPNIEKEFDQQTLNLAHDAYPGGLGLMSAIGLAAREHGWHGHDWRGDLKAFFRHAFGGHGGGAIRASGFSTLDIAGVLGNVANKFYVQYFLSYESTWRMIAKVSTANDFKTRTSYALTGDAKYEKIGPGGEIKHATLGEQSYTNKVDSYGKMFAITYEDLINDDLGALSEIPARLGRGAAIALNEIFWAEFMDNGAFFTSGNGNYDDGTDTVLGIDALTAAEALFFDQTDPDGNPLGVAPRFLLVPNALNAKASQLMRSTEIRDTTASTLYGTNNPHAGKFEVVRSSYLSNSGITGYSTKAWYLLADPADMPVIEIAFLFGRDVPTVESADADFNTLGVQFRGTHHFGVNLQEKRGGVKFKGEN